MVVGEGDGDEGGIEEEGEEELVAIGFDDSPIRRRSYGEERKEKIFLRRPTTTKEPTSS